MEKIVSAHKLNGGERRTDRERKGVGAGKGSRLCGWAGEVGLELQIFMAQDLALCILISS